MKKKDQSTEISVESIQKAVDFGMNEMISLVELTRTYALSAVKDYNAGTAKGRQAIASLAAKVSKVKARIDKESKQKTSGAREMIANINETRTYATKALADLRDEIRRPVTEFEDLERAAAEEIENQIQRLRLPMESLDDHTTLEEMYSEKAHIEGIAIGITFGGRMNEARDIRDNSVKHIYSLISRKEEAAQVAREAKRIKEIEEQAKTKAEAKAAADIREIELKMDAEIEAERLQMKIAMDAEIAAAELQAKKQAWEKREEEKKTEFLRRVAEEAKKPPSKLEQANNTLSERLVREDTERLQSPSVRTFTCTEGTFENNAHLFAEAIIKRNNNRLDTAIELQPPGDEIDTAHACMNQWMKKT